MLVASCIKLMYITYLNFDREHWLQSSSKIQIEITKKKREKKKKTHQQMKITGKNLKESKQICIKTLNKWGYACVKSIFHVCYHQNTREFSFTFKSFNKQNQRPILFFIILLLLLLVVVVVDFSFFGNDSFHMPVFVWQNVLVEFNVFYALHEPIVFYIFPICDVAVSFSIHTHTSASQHSSFFSLAPFFTHASQKLLLKRNIQTNVIHWVNRGRNDKHTLTLKHNFQIQ